MQGSYAVILDTSMRVSEALRVLALHGFWMDATRPAVRDVIQEVADTMGAGFDETEQRLSREFSLVGAAIRRQWYARVLWYPRTVLEVLANCIDAADDATLLDALHLHETDSRPPVHLEDGEVPDDLEAVVFAGGQPVSVNLEGWGAAPVDDTASPTDDWQADTSVSAEKPPEDAITLHGYGPMADVGGGGFAFEPDRMDEAKPPGPTAQKREIRAWPRIEAPQFIPADTPFDVVVGLAKQQQRGVAGGQVVIHLPEHVSEAKLSVDLVADGLKAPDGWSRTLTVSRADPGAAEVGFRLVGEEPTGQEPFTLTMLTVHYSYQGGLCGTAWKPLVIGHSDAQSPDLQPGMGESWLDQDAAAQPLEIRDDPQTPDLTITLSKPDGNPATGRYACSLTSPHELSVGTGPFRVDLGANAQGFTQSIVSQVRTYAKNPLVDKMLKGSGKRIAEKLGSPVLKALHDVAAKVAPAVPTVLLVSTESYVPWELAVLNPPLDPSKPPYLGAQVALGRWITDTSSAIPMGTTDSPDDLPPPRPPHTPLAALDVSHMAVLAGVYQISTGLKRLPKAEDEVKHLASTYHAIQLEASPQAIGDLVGAQITDQGRFIGGVDAVHFAGHGSVDTNEPTSSVIYLSDGTPLFAAVFQAADYGDTHSPLIFLNACLVGQAGEVLGDTGGFPGNCLKGGFGGVVGALWEVDDDVAHDLAIEFWARVLPLDDSPAEPVAEVLRDLRSRFLADPAGPAIPTYLSYVYYGHPRLTLSAVKAGGA